MSQPMPRLACALCEQPLDPLGTFFRASGAFLPARDDLSRFCNSPLHWHCYSEWPDRPRFARHYVEAWVAANRRNPFWWTAYRDAHVYISVNPEPPIEEVSIRLYAVGSDIRVPLARWSAWLVRPEQVTPGLQPVELQELERVLPPLRARVPTDHAVVDAIDPDEKQAGKRRSPRPEASPEARA